jgi:hypothetical protein
MGESSGSKSFALDTPEFRDRLLRITQVGAVIVVGCVVGGLIVANFMAGGTSGDLHEQAIWAEPVARLKRVVETADADHPEDYNEFLAEVARSYLPTDARGKTVLDDASANDQVQYIADNWDELSPAEAQRMANHGVLVVATRKGVVSIDSHSLQPERDDEGRPILTPGHVAVVMPGEPYGNGYPKIAGDTMMSSPQRRKPQRPLNLWSPTDDEEKQKEARVKWMRFYTPKSKTAVAIDANASNPSRDGKDAIKRP